MTNEQNQDPDGNVQLTIPALLGTVAARYGNRLALLDAQVDVSARTTHKELLAETERLSRRIGAVASRHGRTRPRIVLVLPNGAGLARSLLAVTLAGEAAPLNPRLTQSEYSAEFSLLRPDAVLLGAGSPEAAAEAAKEQGLAILRLDEDAEQSNLPPPSPPNPDDTALVLMTSGSTGKAKVVPLSHRNVCISSRDVARSISLTEDDCALVMWEQFHIGGLVDLLLAPLSVGGSVAITAGFDAGRFFRYLSEIQPTWFQAVPTTLGELARQGAKAGFEGPSSLRLIRSVAAALSPGLQGTVETMFSVPVIRTLGMTEAGPLITSTRLPPAPQKPGSVGAPAGPEVRILNGSGAPVDAGEEGEVVVRGDNVFAGYEAGGDNADAFINGWFRTGDIGRFDADGDLFLTGRIKDMINRGGEKINPAEVDAALLAVAGVHEAACFSLPHATLGEDIAAAVVASPDVDAQKLRQDLSQRLASHKIPGRFYFSARLPKTPVGKIDRPALATAARQQGVAEPPRAGMETLLAGIWAEELGKPVLDRNVDFADLDGDSLSMVRVVAAIENTFDAVLPDTVFEHLTCIAETAAFLIEQGYTPEPPETSVQEPEISTKAQNSGALEGLTGFEADFQDQVLKAIAACRSRTALHFILRDIDRFTTVADLQRLARKLRFVVPGATPDQPLLKMHRLRRILMWRNLRKWRHGINRENKTQPETCRWSKRSVAPACFIYGQEDGQPADKTLVVAFAGNALRLGMPIRWFLAALDPAHYDVALVVDPAKQRFEKGSPGLGTGLISVADNLNRLLPTESYSRVIGFGHSGGAHAAVAAAILNGWDSAVAAVPGQLSEHHELTAQFSAATTSHDRQSSYPRIVCARGTRQKEIDAVDEIRDRLGPITLHVEPIPFKNILFHAHQARALPTLLRTLLS